MFTKTNFWNIAYIIFSETEKVTIDFTENTEIAVVANEKYPEFDLFQVPAGRRVIVTN